MPQFSEPLSVPDDLADGWDDMVRRNQLLQAINDPSFGPQLEGLGDAGTNGDDLPTADWMAQRTQQIAHALNPAPEASLGDSGNDTLASGQGTDSLEGGVGDDVIRTAPAKPLTGRTPTSSNIANGVDAIVAGPNTSAPIHTKWFDGTLQRGSGRDVHLHGDVQSLGPFDQKGVDVSGVLDEPDGRGGVTISGIKGGPRHATLPQRFRLFNGPNGELEVDIADPVKYGPLQLRPPGRYAIP